MKHDVNLGVVGVVVAAVADCRPVGHAGGRGVARAARRHLGGRGDHLVRMLVMLQRQAHRPVPARGWRKEGREAQRLLILVDLMP